MSRTRVIHNGPAQRAPLFHHHDNALTAYELKSLMFGAEIGMGASRKVYASTFDERIVIKYEFDYTYQNVIEWETWHRVKTTNMAQWFAPCYHLSTGGVYLTMARVTPLPNDRRPTKLPAIFSDVKMGNFGLYEDRVVCCDYGTILEHVFTGSPTKLVKPKWIE